MGQRRETLIGCLVVMLVPLARICLRNSIKLNDLIEVMKKAFVEAARKEVAKEGGSSEVSFTKISTMTGVHRKDVTRIVREPNQFKPRSDIIMRIMVQWQTSKKYRTKAGKPRVLNAEGRDSEFAKLVESVNGGNINAYAILEEMVRLGIVEKKAKRVRLVWRDFVVSEDVSEGLRMLAEDSRDLTRCVDENLTETRQSPNLHLRTEFDAIERDSLPEIRLWLLEQGSLFHKKVREYLADFDLDINPELRGSGAKGRVVVGAFSLSEMGENHVNS